VTPRRSVRAGVSAVLGAVALASASESPSASARAQSVPPGGSAQERVALSFCQDGLAGPPIALSGPRLQWSRHPGGAPDEVLRSVTARMRDVPQSLVAANDAWAAIYEPARQTLTRADCAAHTAATRPSAIRAVEIAVSDTGDIALRTPAGDVAVEPSSAWTSASPSDQAMLTHEPASPFGAIVWVGRSLWMLANDHVQIADANKGSYRARIPATSHETGIARAFVFNGVVYAIRENGCVDVFSAQVNTPRLRRAACLPGAQAGYVGFDDEKMRVIAADGAVQWQGPRLSAVTARFTGGVRTITANLATLASWTWVPKVPLGANSPPAAAPVPGETADAMSTWRARLKPEWWSSPASFEAGIAALTAKGWTDFHDEGSWAVANGLSLQWQNGSSFVAPEGRRLAALAAELYSEREYSPAQIEDILNGNAVLGRSLEGRLFRNPWLPIGALLGSSTDETMPYASLETIHSLAGVSRKAARSPAVVTLIDRLQAIKSLDSCATTEADAGLTEIARSGLPVIGRGPAQFGSAFELAGGLQLRAGNASVLVCTVPGSAEPVRLAVLRNVQLAASKGEFDLSRLQKPVERGGSTYQQSQDANWPVGLEGAVVVAVARGSTIDAAQRSQLLSAWMDRVFIHARVAQVRVPASILEVRFAVEYGWQWQFKGLTNVSVVSAERLPGLSRARADGCGTPQEIADRRRLYEQLLKLSSVAHATRSIAFPEMIGVVENAIDLDNAIFTRANGEPVWLEFDSGQHFVPRLTGSPAPATGSPLELLHGTQVASLLFSQAAPSGMLSDVQLTWVVATDPKLSVLGELAAQRNVVNVSQMLSPAWDSLRTNLAGPGFFPLLLVAAAHNKPDRDDGPPIAWGLPNVIGVGVANKDGATPADILATYEAPKVDLLAPGIEVPAIGPAQAECVDGTSFAAVYVTVVAALVQKQSGGGLDGSQLRARLLATATWRPEYWNHVRGGLVNAERALDLDKNVLMWERSDGSTAEFNVTLSLGQFSATGINQDLADTPLAKTIAWTDVLRLTRMTAPLPDPATGQLQATYRLVFLDHGLLAVWKDVRIDPSTAAIPVTTCVRRPDLVSSTCSAVDLASVVDYIAAKPGRTGIRF
jgi:hypothetical protein